MKTSELKVKNNFSVLQDYNTFPDEYLVSDQRELSGHGSGVKNLRNNSIKSLIKRKNFNAFW